jgi:hypothetical protein
MYYCQKEKRKERKRKEHVPNPLLSPQLPRMPQRQRVDGIPGRAQAQAPGVVEGALGVDENLDFPLAADLDDPSVGRWWLVDGERGKMGDSVPLIRLLLVRLRDSNAVDFGVVVGQVGEQFECLFGDWW